MDPAAQRQLIIQLLQEYAKRNAMQATLPGQPPAAQYMQQNPGLQMRQPVQVSNDPAVALEQAKLRGEHI